MKLTLFVLFALPLLAIAFSPGGASSGVVRFSIVSPSFPSGGTIPAKRSRSP